jgi:hypothetical protein
VSGTGVEPFTDLVTGRAEKSPVNTYLPHCRLLKGPNVISNDVSKSLHTGVEGSADFDVG